MKQPTAVVMRLLILCTAALSLRDDRKGFAPCLLLGKRTRGKIHVTDLVPLSEIKDSLRRPTPEGGGHDGTVHAWRAGYLAALHQYSALEHVGYWIDVTGESEQGLQLIYERTVASYFALNGNSPSLVLISSSATAEDIDIFEIFRDGKIYRREMEPPKGRSPRI